jgi:hypothetical protein
MHVMKALLIPADPTRPVEMIKITGRDDTHRYLGGIAEATQYDHDAVMYVDDVGRIHGKPINARATEYIVKESEAAKQGRMIGIDPSYGLYGEVVVVGFDGHGGLQDVPNRFIDRYDVPQRAKDTTTVSTEDLRQVINIANDIEDVSPEKRSALNRIRNTVRDRNEDGMLRLPWRDKGPYVVEMSLDGEAKYLSRDGMEDLGPAFDAVDKAATFEVKNDARHFAAIADSQGLAGGGKLKVIPEREAVDPVRQAPEQHDQELEQSIEQSHREPYIETDEELQSRLAYEAEVTDAVFRAEALDQELQQSLDQSLNRGHHRGR